MIYIKKNKKTSRKKIIHKICLILLTGLVWFWPLIFLVHYDTKNMMSAIQDGDIVKVEEMLQKGLDPNQTDRVPCWVWGFYEMSPERPINVACDVGNLEMVKLLIDYGATAEYNEEVGRSPLRETVLQYQTDDVEIVKLLLENGANPDIDYDYSVLVVFEAASMYPINFDIPREERKDYDEDAAKGITEIVKLLLENDDINMTTKSGKSLLMCAADCGNLYLAEYLLSCGCNKELVDTYGKTALDYAIEDGNEQMIALLKEN